MKAAGVVLRRLEHPDGGQRCSVHVHAAGFGCSHPNEAQAVGGELLILDPVQCPREQASMEHANSFGS